jgi:hypothetical protein
MEQELLTLLEHLSSHLVFSGVRVINRRKTDNTMATKGQTTIYKALHRKLKI